MALIQLDFFEPTETSVLKAEFKTVKESCDRVRKKQFAEIGALKKDIAELKELVNLLVANICKG
ncbi:hypothetical protein UFOVP264_39 [uncultured Caudovirales phage]|uniref:Uncharacterized protein n=1 Tax=uncultured Caudovirales phage TaxID=2100421 RepID=A0A6J5LJV2_9CAUD|nr:hypothetical protein UFOVP264_39 [uncultured Caudovirales phage]